MLTENRNQGKFLWDHLLSTTIFVASSGAGILFLLSLNSSKTENNNIIKIIAMGNIITSRTNIASISNIEIELSAMNKDTDWVFVEDESLSSIARGRDGSKQIQYVLLKQEDGDVLIYEALDGDGNPLTYEHWAILMSEDSFYGKQARSETAKVIKVSDRI